MELVDTIRRRYERYERPSAIDPILIRSSEIAARELASSIARVLLPPNLTDLRSGYSTFLSSCPSVCRLVRASPEARAHPPERSRIARGIGQSLTRDTRARALQLTNPPVHTVRKRRKKGNRHRECKKPSGRRRIRLCHLPFGLGERRASRSLARRCEKNAQRAAFSHTRHAECFVNRIVNFNVRSEEHSVPNIVSEYRN